MSVYVSAWVWKYSKAKGSDKLVLLAIADQAHDDGSGAWPAVPTIAARCGVSDRSVQRAIKNLAERGELLIVERARENGSRTSNEYWVLMKGGVTK